MSAPKKAMKSLEVNRDEEILDKSVNTNSELVERKSDQKSELESYQAAEMRIRISKSAIFSDFALRILFKVADFAVLLDRQLLAASKWVFEMFPAVIQQALRKLNSEFKAGRNRIAGIAQANLQLGANQDAQSELELQRGDVPGWVLVVLMTTGLVTALWTIAAPRLSQLLRNSLDSMNSIR